MTPAVETPVAPRWQLWGALLLVGLALAAVLLTRTPPAAGGPATTAAGSTAGSGAVVVDHTAFSCPDQPHAAGVTTTVRLGLAPVPDGERVRAVGRVRQGPVTAAGEPLTLRRGRSVTVPATGGPAVDATGGAAAGIFGFRTDVEKGRSLAVAPCAAPRSQWWFTGAGAGLDHRSSLLLANVDRGPAVVDLRLLGPDGDVQTVATRGIPLEPGSARRLDLTDLAPLTDDLALGVRATRGRVVAAVSDSYRARPQDRLGREWLAATDLPRRTVRLSGLPAGADAATLLVANPSDLEAVVSVKVAGRSGSFTPTGLGTVSVAPGAVTRVDLRRALPRAEAVSLRLTSRVPVVATVRAGVRADHADAAPVSPLTGPAAAALPAGARASVHLTAGSRGTRVDLAAYDASGRRVDGTTLAVPATATRTWSPARRADYLVVTPPRGPGQGAGVHGAVSYAGDGVAVVPLTTLPWRLLRPAVHPGLR